MNPEAQNLWQGDQTNPEPAAQVPVAEPLARPAENTPAPIASELATDGPVEEQSDISTPISWQASEYILHEKNSLWFVGLAVGTLVLMAVSVFLLGSLTFTILIALMVAATVVYALRPPRTLDYRLTHSSLQIDDKHYSLHDFRSFGVLQEGGIYSIMLLPVKRFMPPVSLYFPAEIGEEIVDTLGSSIPMEKLRFDFIDRLVRKLRF